MFSGFLSGLHVPPLLNEMTDFIRPSERKTKYSGQYSVSSIRILDITLIMKLMAVY